MGNGACLLIYFENCVGSTLHVSPENLDQVTASKISKKKFNQVQNSFETTFFDQDTRTAMFRDAIRDGTVF